MKMDLKKLTKEEKAALTQVALYLDHEIDWDNYSKDEDYFSILEPSEGCVPDGFAIDGGDLLEVIRRKFACVYWAAMELASLQRPDHASQPFELIISPETDAATPVIIASRGLNIILYRDATKAWYFNFKSLKEVAKFVISVSQKIKFNERAMTSAISRMDASESAAFGRS